MTVQFREVTRQDNMTPFFYDFKAQKMVVIEFIRKEEVLKIRPLLKEVVENGKLKHPAGWGYGWYKFHPDFREALNKVFLTKGGASD